MSDFIGIYEGLASDDYCDRMIAKHKELLDTCSHKADDGRKTNGGAEARLDVAFYYERDCTELAQETHQIMNEAVRRYCLEHPSAEFSQFYSRVVKVQQTMPKGGFHRWHSELSYGEAQARHSTWIIYLNDTPEGEGTTEFLEYGVKLQPKKGTVVIFPASWTHTHRGNPMYTADKYIATGWYYYDN